MCNGTKREIRENVGVGMIILYVLGIYTESIMKNFRYVFFVFADFNNKNSNKTDSPRVTDKNEHCSPRRQLQQSGEPPPPTITASEIQQQHQLISSGTLRPERPNSLGCTPARLNRRILCYHNSNIPCNNSPTGNSSPSSILPPGKRTNMMCRGNEINDWL